MDKRRYVVTVVGQYSESEMVIRLLAVAGVFSVEVESE